MIVSSAEILSVTATSQSNTPVCFSDLPLTGTLYATKYLQGSVGLRDERIYKFKPVVSGVYTICTTPAGKAANYVPTGSGDTLTDTFIEVFRYSTPVDSTPLTSNDDIATNTWHEAYNPTKISNGWRNYNSSITYYFKCTETYAIRLKKGGTKSNVISYNIHVKSYAGSLFGYFYGSPTSPVSTNLSSEQGCTIDLSAPHEGIDMNRNKYYPIYSPDTGVVMNVGGSTADSRGYFIEVQYYIDGKYQYFRFLHLMDDVKCKTEADETNPNKYKINDTVFKGDKLGVTGGTGEDGVGNSYPIHLHMDIHTGTNKGGTLTDPNKYYANTLVYN